MENEFQFSLVVEKLNFENGKLLYGDILRVIPITAAEYREFLKLLKDKGTIDSFGIRIDGKAVSYYFGLLEKLEKFAP